MNISSKLMGLVGILVVIGCQPNAGWQDHVNNLSITDSQNKIENSNLGRAKAADDSHNYGEAMRWWLKIVNEGDGITYVASRYMTNEQISDAHSSNISYAQFRIGIIMKKDSASRKITAKLLIGINSQLTPPLIPPVRLLSYD